MKMPTALDAPYKLFRRKMPSELYIGLQGLVGRRKTYYSVSYHLGIVDQYRQRVPIEDRTVLEIGPGNEIATAVFMVLLGARRVYLVDRIDDNPFSTHGSGNDVPYIRELLHAFEESALGKSHAPAMRDPELILERIQQVDCWFTNPRVEALLDGPRPDVILSHFVLEHIFDLDAVFRNLDLILADDGVMYHDVDLSDHSYHVFTKYPWATRLFVANILRHLEYSSRTWARLDDPKAVPMNRALLPKYLELCDRYRFRTERLSTTAVSHAFAIHPDLLADVVEPRRTAEMLDISAFELTLSRP